MAYRASASPKQHAKVLVYGDPGTGKTMWASRTANPFVILTEHHAGLAISCANPGAWVEPVSDWREFRDVMDSVSAGAVRQLEDGTPCYSFRHDGQLYQINTLVIDTLSQIHDWLVSTYRAKVDGADAPHWSRIQNEFKALFDELRRLPVNLICTAHAKETTDSKQRVSIGPDVYGRLTKTLGKYFNAVAYSMKKAGEEGTRYGLVFDGPGSLITKQMPSPLQLPSVLMHDIHTPGLGTLGSLQLYVGLQSDSPTYEGDSAEWVEKRLQEEADTRARMLASQATGNEEDEEEA